jgi:hypothetical protein
LLSDKQILGLENDDHSYFYNGLFAARSADAYAALLGVDPMLEGAPPRAPVEPPNLAASIDKTGASRNHKKQLERRNGLVFWALLIFILLSAYGLSRPPISVPWQGEIIGFFRQLEATVVELGSTFSGESF